MSIAKVAFISDGSAGARPIRAAELVPVVGIVDNLTTAVALLISIDTNVAAAVLIVENATVKPSRVMQQEQQFKHHHSESETSLTSFVPNT